MPQLSPFYDYRYFHSLDGTNAEAIRQAETGAQEGLLIHTSEQQAGRGRRGRDWASPPGNLYCSILLRPEEEAHRAALISFVAALAVADLAAHYLGVETDLKLKWPNDVLLAGSKLSGILLESSAGQNNHLKWLVIGMGVNLAYVPTGIDQAAAALSDHMEAPDPDEAVIVLANRFLHWLDRFKSQGFAPIRAAWLAKAKGLGDEITVRLPNETLKGQFSGLDEQGALILETGSNSRRITTGEVFF